MKPASSALSVCLVFVIFHACATQAKAESQDITECKQALSSLPPRQAMTVLEAAEKKRLSSGAKGEELIWLELQMAQLAAPLNLETQELIGLGNRLLENSALAYGEQHPNTAMAISYLVKPLTLDPSNRARVEALLDRYDRIAKANIAHDPQLQLDGLQLRGALHTQMGQHEEALSCYKKSLENWEKINPTGIGWAASSMLHIARCAVCLGRNETVLKYGKMSVENYERAGQIGISNYFEAQVCWGHGLHFTGQPEAALPHFQRAYDYFVTYKPLPIELCAAASSAASRLGAYASNVEKRYDKAAGYVMELEYFYVHGKSETDPSTISAAVQLAQVCAACGRIADAVSAYERVLERRRRVFGDNSDTVKQTTAALAGLRAEVRRASNP